MKIILVLLVLGVGSLVQAQQPAPDFNARCAANYQWRAVTNQIGQSEAKVTVLKQNYSQTLQLKKQTNKATHKKSSLSPEEATAKHQVQAEEANLAALKLQKNKIEDGIKQMMPTEQRPGTNAPDAAPAATKKHKAKQ